VTEQTFSRRAALASRKGCGIARAAVAAESSATRRLSRAFSSRSCAIVPPIDGRRGASSKPSKSASPILPRFSRSLELSGASDR
jgi:hypothetical protein